MIALTALYCDFDPDFHGQFYPKLRYKMMGSDSNYFMEIDSGTDVLSLKEFDYSQLRELVVSSSSSCNYRVDVQKLLTLSSLRVLSIDENSTYINGSVQDILKGMLSVNELKLEGFKQLSSLDLSSLNCTSVCIYGSDIHELVLPSARDISLELDGCTIYSKDIISDLYTIVLTNGRIEKLTVTDSRYAREVTA